MQEEIITMYVVGAEVLDMLEVKDAPQTTMTTAEVMTTALVAARCLGGCVERSRAFLKHEHYIARLLGQSRFNRRLHAMPEARWQAVLAAGADAHHMLNPARD